MTMLALRSAEKAPPLENVPGRPPHRSEGSDPGEAGQWHQLGTDRAENAAITVRRQRQREDVSVNGVQS